MKYFLLLLFSFFIQNRSQAQELQSPSEFLGYELGDQFTRHHRMVSYFEYLAGKKSNIVLEQYGETYEGRPLITAIISSQQNIEHLDEIRKNNLRLTGLEPGLPSSDNKKAIVWLSYNVHGNEAVSMEAAMQTMYKLANEGNAVQQEWLKNTVVIIDPCLNPDGRDRYANFFNRFKNSTPNPDINSKEHREPWPGGRANHYLFDLNRDWAWLKQKESKARLKKYHEWMPHVHVDFHEQSINSPYYFAPAAEPFHNAITPWQKEFQNTIGMNNARYFDKNHWLYFTREIFDLLYPGYGDTYPTFNGAIGMTYEQGGSGSAGLVVETETGDSLTLKERIEHHHTTSLSTIETTSKSADRVVEEFENYFKEKPSTEYKSYIVKGSNHPDKLRRLTEFMDAHKIRYSAAPKIMDIKAYDYLALKTRNIQVETSDILISVAQPKSRLISVFFEPSTFLEDSLTYDITAWSLPWVYGLEAYALKIEIEGTGEFVVPKIKGKTPAKPYAYIFPWNTVEDARFLSALYKKGIKVRSSENSFAIGGNEFPPGSLIITKTDNKEHDLDMVIPAMAKKYYRTIYGTSTGFADSGYDLGSGEVKYLPAPKIAVLSGEQTSSLSFGEIWYFFEQELDYQITVLDTDYFERVDHNKYDVLIIPNGNYSIFNEELLKKLNEWVKNGGRLIAIGNALESFKDKEGWKLKEFEDEEQKEKLKEQEEEKSDPLLKYGDQKKESLGKSTPGAIYMVKLDNTHPLGFGYHESYFLMKTSDKRYAFLPDGWNVGIIEEPEVASGFVGWEVNEKLRNSLVLGVGDIGSGEVIYFVDNPLFRAFWENGKLMFANAVFLVGM